MKKDDFKLANKLAIPPTLFSKLSKKDLYILEKNVPDEIEQYWDLASFPKYLIKKYDLTPKDPILPSTNATQKDIELFLSWKLTSFFATLDRGNAHYALMLPKYDRGIECYIRCLDVEKEFLVAIPIQICEIVFTQETLENKDYEKAIFDLAVKAKGKPVDCSGTILLMVLKGDGSVNLDTTVDRYALRDLFETVAWSYRKIILLSTTKTYGDTYVTVFADCNDEHFIGHAKNGAVKILLGRTKKDEIATSNKCNLGSSSKNKLLSFTF